MGEDVKFEYGLFCAEAITIGLTIVLVFAAVAGLAIKAKKGENGAISIKNLNERFNEVKESVQKELLSKKQLKQLAKDQERKTGASGSSERPRIFVLDFDGDTSASQVE